MKNAVPWTSALFEWPDGSRRSYPVPEPPTVPAYAQDLARFEVRALTGDYAPQIGGETIIDAIDALGAEYSDWLTNPPSGSSDLRSIIAAWCGAAQDPAGRRLFITGGGHQDGSCNGVFEYDFTADLDGLPTGFRVLPNTLSRVEDVPPASTGPHITYSDGLPGAVHSYHGLAFDPLRQAFFRVGGSPWWSQGAFTNAAFEYRLDDATWTTVNVGGAFNWYAAVADPATGVILFAPQGGSNTTWYFWDGTTVTPVSAGAGYTDYAVFIYDSDRGRVYVIGDGQFFYHNVNFANRTLGARQNVTASGDTGVLALEALTGVYDSKEPPNGAIWLWGPTAQNLHNRVWRIDAETFVIEEIPFSGDTIQFGSTAQQYQGSFNRGVLMPNGLFGFVTSHMHAAYVVPLRMMNGGSVEFVTNAAGDNEYAQLTTLPEGFGDGEFTFEIRVWADNTVGTGDTSEQGSTAQRTLWSSNDEAPYSAPDWWFQGNFLLDGHNNDDFEDGTFSIQIYGEGRVRWTFGDGAAAGARTGGLHAVQADDTQTAPSILDGQPHTITCVRRWDEGTGAILELYIDGELVGTETTTARTDMASTYWDNWSGFPSGQEGWFFGAEKQAAIGVLSQYEDFKGLVGEIRFWSIARDPADIAATAHAPIDPESEGLVGLYRFDEGRGSTAADKLGNGGDIILNAGANGQQVTWARSVF